MRYTAINPLEEKFWQNSGNGAYNLQKISIPVPNENLKLEGYLCTPHNRSGYYYSVEHPKQRIVLHYTAGSLGSDIFTLSSHNRHVSVPFVIARDGTIYQLFSSKFWSGHLGKGLGNTNTGNAQDKSSIGIEISNYGFLTEKAGNLETYYSRLKNANGVPGPVDVYCSLAEREAYEKLSSPFRQQVYYATYSEAQYESLIILLRYLTAQYNIPRQFLPESVRYQATNEVLNFKGIVTHINYRVDGKWDIGPALNWKKLIDGVQAVEFKPTLHRGAVTRGAENALGSEQELDSLLPEAKDAAQENDPYEEVQRTSGDEGKNIDPKKKRGIKSKDEKELPTKTRSARKRFMEHSAKAEPPNDFRESVEAMPPASTSGSNVLESTGDLPSVEPPSITKSTNVTRKSREGQLEYDIPGQMQTGKKYTCKIYIAGNEVDAAAMKIGDASVHAAIFVSDEMSVRLIDSSGGDYFNIVPVSTERQAIDKGEMTKWLFNVTPKQSGNHPLVLKITMHTDGKNKDLDILEKEVLVSSVDAATTSSPQDDITRILYISANPLDTAALRIGAETRQIKEEIGLAKNRDKFLFTTNLAVTTRTLSRSILQEDPAIVHFSGHGEEEGLCLETESGAIKMVEGKALEILFKNFSSKIKCVILNACFSKAQANAIVKHIPFVIGMNKAVEDEAALAFSVGFYQALTDGSDIEQAFNIGLAGMAMSSSGQENVAELLKKN